MMKAAMAMMRATRLASLEKLLLPPLSPEAVEFDESMEVVMGVGAIERRWEMRR